MRWLQLNGVWRKTTKLFNIFCCCFFTRFHTILWSTHMYMIQTSALVWFRNYFQKASEHLRRPIIICIKTIKCESCSYCDCYLSSNTFCEKREKKPIYFNWTLILAVRSWNLSRIFGLFTNFNIIFLFLSCSPSSVMYYVILNNLRKGPSTSLSQMDSIEIIQ